MRKALLVRAAGLRSHKDPLKKLHTVGMPIFQAFFNMVLDLMNDRHPPAGWCSVNLENFLLCRGKRLSPNQGDWESPLGFRV